MQQSDVSFKDRGTSEKKIRKSLQESSIGNSIDGPNLVKEIEMIA